MSAWTGSFAYYAVTIILILLCGGCLAVAFKPSFDAWRRDRRNARRGDLPEALFRRLR